MSMVSPEHDRPQNTSWNCLETTSLTLALTLIHMEPILSDEVDASIFPLSEGGLFVRFVIEEAGVLSSHI